MIYGLSWGGSLLRYLRHAYLKRVWMGFSVKCYLAFFQMFSVKIAFSNAFSRIPLYSLVFSSISLYSPIFPCILLCSPVFSCILLYSPVFPCILLYSPVFSRSPRCSPVFPCIPLYQLNKFLKWKCNNDRGKFSLSSIMYLSAEK